MNSNKIYKHTCNINNKSYIGKTKRDIDTRFNEHIRRSLREDTRLSHFEYALRKYGEDNFTSELLQDNIKDEIANDREIYWIEYYDTFNNGYNMTKGGDGAALFGKNNGMYGKKHSKETKQKLSISCKENCSSGEADYKTNIIRIYNSDDELMFESRGSFRKFCKDNSLPTVTFANSYKSDGEPIYQNVGNNKARLIKEGFWIMKGWYAVRENSN